MAPGNDNKRPSKTAKSSTKGKNKKTKSHGNTFFEDEEYQRKGYSGEDGGDYYEKTKAVFNKKPEISPPLGSKVPPSRETAGSRSSYGGFSSQAPSANGSSYSGFVSSGTPSNRPPSGRPSGNRPPSNRPPLQRDSSIRPPLGRNGASRGPNNNTNKPSQHQVKPPLTKLQKLLIKVGVVVLFVLIGTLVFYFGFVKPNDNYDAQMRIGVKHFNAMEYEDAELAFNKALVFQPKDPDATIGLSDTLIATGRFDEAVPLLTEMQASYIEDERTYDRLITIYITHLPDIAKANAQIIACVANGIRPENELVSPGPDMDPNGGTFSERISVTINVAEGHVVQYTTDGTMPTSASAIYEKPISLTTNQETTITAVSTAPDGLITWPNAVEFKLKIEHAFNSLAVELVGSTAKEIMESEGPLFYSSSESDGIYYTTEAKNFYFIFSTGVLDGGDPTKVPLPGSARAIAVSMDASNYVLSMPETMSVEELTQGLGIKEYSVEESGGTYFLGFYKSSLYFSFTLKDKNTLTDTSNLTVYD